MRAGGPISSAADVLDRQAAIAEQVDEDPHFAWVLRSLLDTEADPPPTPGAAIRLSFSRGPRRLLADAVPRSSSAIEHHGPSAVVIADDAKAATQLARLMRDLEAHGGRLRMREGVKVRLAGLPRPFGELVPELLEGEVLIRTVFEPSSFPAVLRADTNRGKAELALELHGVEPPDDWDLAWHGERGGLEVEITSKWEVERGRGVTKLSWRFRPGLSTAPLAERAAAARLMVAVHGAGRLRITDRTDNSERLNEPLASRALPEDTAEIAVLLDALEVIETFTGRPAPAVPEDIARSDIDKLAVVALNLRNGGYMTRTRASRIVLSSADVTAFRRAGSTLKIRETAEVRALGEVIPVAQRRIDLPHMVVSHAERVPGTQDQWQVTLVPLAAAEIEVWAELRLLPT